MKLLLNLLAICNPIANREIVAFWSSIGLMVKYDHLFFFWFIHSNFEMNQLWQMKMNYHYTKSCDRWSVYAFSQKSWPPSPPWSSVVLTKPLAIIPLHSIFVYYKSNYSRQLTTAFHISCDLLSIATDFWLYSLARHVFLFVLRSCVWRWRARSKEKRKKKKCVMYVRWTWWWWSTWLVGWFTTGPAIVTLIIAPLSLHETQLRPQTEKSAGRGVCFHVFCQCVCVCCCCCCCCCYCVCLPICPLWNVSNVCMSVSCLQCHELM